MTRKEERERMRQERLAAQQAASASEKRRLYLGYGVAGLIVAAIVIGLGVAIAGGGDGEQTGRDAEGNEFPELAYIQDEIGAVPPAMEPDGREGTTPPEQQTGILEDAAEAANCELQLNLPEEGNSHFSNEDREVDYKTSPPTSGDHYAGNETGSGALADGAYLNYPPITRVVHSLEHGRVAIHYSPDLPEAEQLEIKGLFEESPEGMLLFPNPEMDDYEVAITAWTQLAGCESYEGVATLDVLRTFRDTYLNKGPEFFPLSV